MTKPLGFAANKAAVRVAIERAVRLRPERGGAIRVTDEDLRVGVTVVAARRKAGVPL